MKDIQGKEYRGEFREKNYFRGKKKEHQISKKMTRWTLKLNFFAMNFKEKTKCGETSAV